MARLQYCREHLTDEVAEACGYSKRSVAEVRQAAKFCDEHGDFSQLTTKPIIALIRVKNTQVREKAIIKCQERLNGKIGAGRGNTKKLTEKVVKKIVEDIEIEVRNEKIDKEVAEQEAEEERTGIKSITPEEVDQLMGRGQDTEPLEALTNNMITRNDHDRFFEIMLQLQCGEDVPKYKKRVKMMIDNKTLRIV